MSTRLDIYGRETEGKEFTARCYDCGMPLLDVAEYHPIAACKAYRRSHDSRDVWRDGKFVAQAGSSS